MNWDKQISRRDFLTLFWIVWVWAGAAILATPLALQASIIKSAEKIGNLINLSPEKVEIRNHIIELSRLDNSRNFPIWTRIWIITDLHINEFNYESLRQLNKISELNLDLLIIAWDFIPKHTNWVNEYFWVLDDLMKKMQWKVFAVLWNHDYVTEYWKEVKDDIQLKEQLNKWWITVLENENEQLVLRWEKINLIWKGSHLRWRFEGKNQQNVDEKWLNILITHEPIGFDKVQERFDLWIAWHTHWSPDWIIEIAKIMSVFNYKTSFNSSDFEFNNWLYLRNNQLLLTSSWIWRHDVEKYFTQKLIDVVTIA